MVPEKEKGAELQSFTFDESAVEDDALIFDNSSNNTDEEDGKTTSEGDTAASIITIEAEATSLNATVPTNAVFLFKADGTNVYPSNYTISNNNALTAILLNKTDFEGINNWNLTTEDDTFQADQKKFSLRMGLKDTDLSIVDTNNGVMFSNDTEIKIAPNASKTLGFFAKHGIFSNPVTTENAMQMTMHFDWERL